MSAARPRTQAKLAEAMPDDEIHVWLLPYTPSQGRQPLLELLGRYLGVGSERVRLVANPHARPELDPQHGSALRFNWSHSGGFALVAVARHIQPGIDLEQRRPRPRALELARRFFAAAEADALAALPAEQREPAFLRYWTSKEAVLKALGRGLAFGLHRLTIALDDSEPRLTRLEGDDPAAWQLHRLALADELVGALAWRGGVRKLRLRTLPMAERARTADGNTAAPAP